MATIQTNVNDQFGRGKRSPPGVTRTLRGARNPARNCPRSSQARCQQG
ncbi:unnamed protein product [[Actinomadura] parvosata subsp. kistnae]|nr:unnamed protein product [Actinomadura parvosata subsp. kistnae]